jgi:hypothetical protein
VAGSQGAEAVKSGLQPGEKITTIFEPLNLNGPHAGEPYCLICENGLSPVVMVFARELNEPVLALLRKLDEVSVKHKDKELGAFAVFLNEENKLRDELAAAAKRSNFQRLVVGTYAPPGPDGFAVAKDADVTVVLYTEHEVKANHAFRRGELSAAAVSAILIDLPKILSAK